MFEHTLLEPEQEDLLIALVEASRSLPQAQRRPFFFLQETGGNGIDHPGLQGGGQPAYVGDIRTLAAAGLIDVSNASQGTMRFDVTPLGFRYYEHVKKQLREPVERLEQSLTAYVNSERFQQKYPTAYRKWREAEQLVWAADSAQQLTTIGHLCREAMQEFAEVLVGEFQLQEQYTDKIKTVARVRAVLEVLKSKVGSTLAPVLVSLLDYWGTITDLVQRQEHDSQKEGGELVWQDGRRVVLYTGLVMFEIDSVV